MPIFASYGNLREWGAAPEAKAMFKAAGQRAGKTTFLSHSNADGDLVAGAVHILEHHGANVYIDDKDPSLPGSDCLSIAEHLRSVISSCRKFVVLATPNSKDSKWIPWELGLGDGLRTRDHVALFPAAESITDQEWSEREYFGLYRRIVLGRLDGYEGFLWIVWDYRINIAEPLRDWLKR